MPVVIPRVLSSLVLCLLALPVSAVTVTRVDLRGTSDQRLLDNVRSALSLQDAVGKRLTHRRLAYLLQQADAQTRQALEPFGYYAPVIRIQRSDRADPQTVGAPDDDPAAADAPETSQDDVLSVSISIDPGLPVQVRGRQVVVTGAGGDDAQVRAALAAFVPHTGEVLDHSRYEASKTRVNRALAAQGYFDADFIIHQVQVTRAEHAADIDLRWSSGPRYRLGEVVFTQSPAPVLRDELLQKLVGWTPGQAYDAAQLERLRRSLVALDYFGLVDVSATPETAQDKQVLVQVNLTPAPRSIYS